jgi:hypothetical protein
VDLYIDGAALKMIEKQTGIRASEIIHFTDKCCTQDLDGQMWGYFTNLQLVRNTYVDGLTEEDFIGNTEDVADTDEETDDSLLTSSSSDSEEDDVETITFKEVMDAFGNALTGTNFRNGELGAIYTGQKFAETSTSDAYTDIGNNKTSEIDARGNETKYEYDSVTSKPTKVTDRCGN